MHKADEYRERAKAALALMSKCQPSSRELLRDVAAAWLTLADAADASVQAHNLKAAQAGGPAIH